MMDFIKPSSGYIEIPHTADRALLVWGKDAETLFINAAKGMYSLLLIHDFEDEMIERVINIREFDQESLLVSFLSLLLLELEEKKLFYDQISIQIKGKNLKGQLIGKKVKNVDREIKAITYNNLKIQNTKNGNEVEIVFDV